MHLRPDAAQAGPNRETQMYLTALEFLEEERDSWRPFEALLELTDDQLARPVEGARGWSGRDLLGHMVAWQSHALDVARELAVGETSASREAQARDWDARADAVNDDLLASWGALDVAELRRRASSIPGELRGTLTVVPESRFIKHADQETFFVEETIEHYDDHLSDLRSILEAAG